MIWKLAIVAVVVFIGYRYWQGRQMPYAGNVSTGWGGNWTGNLPTVFNPRAIVGVNSAGGVPVTGPNAWAIPYANNGYLN